MSRDEHCEPVSIGGVAVCRPTDQAYLPFNAFSDASCSTPAEIATTSCSAQTPRTAGGRAPNECPLPGLPADEPVHAVGDQVSGTTYRRAGAGSCQPLDTNTTAWEKLRDITAELPTFVHATE